MLFNSFEFLVFFPIVTMLFFVLPHRARWLLLLLASCLFYMAFIPAYILILLFTIVVDYFAGMWIEKARGRKRTACLILSLAANLGVLAVFKYYGFLTENTSLVLRALGLPHRLPVLDIILPIGLSFHTFQAMSYTIEVYRGNQPAERHLGIYALYVMFFPQLVAGPIERPQNLLPQFRQLKRPQYSRFSSGLAWMLWGMFKKVVIADPLSRVVNMVYASPHDYAGPILTLGTVFFAIQIYCDFSGYSDIAVGAARILGFDLMTNFRRPYFATSIADFWRRWHISLSTWFRDYLYIPLGGSRVATLRRCLNIMIVFLLSGLWHGATWMFVIWGALHGLYLIVGVLFSRWRTAIGILPSSEGGGAARRVLQSVSVFVLVLVSWVFFRAKSLGDATYIVSHMFSWDGFSGQTIWQLGLPRFNMGIVLAAIPLLFLVDYILETGPEIMTTFWAWRPARWATYVAALYAIVCFGFFGRVEFIYFQF
jgi:D-alanyl-lipoteichoic acid acyltransferase DltB (MBOAT superfamily)